MKFSEIYSESITQIKETLRSWWINDKMTIEEKLLLEDFIEKYVSKVNGDNTVVQSMYPWQSSVDPQASSAINLVNPVWREKFTPFVHQAEAWEKLLIDKKSIVVTTGTGSGKTECFLVPVIKDLADSATTNNRLPDDFHPVEALFLYPLNALMNDQKERIDKFLYNLDGHGNNVSFAVYNGNTPENENAEEYLAAKNVAEAVAEKTKKNAKWCNDPVVLHERITREQIRDNGSSILITNPSMLEYMLLRKKDNDIFEKSRGQLRWIVIDETHTFTGAAAAELAYLLRRVMLAFDVQPDQVRFVTSSATISGASGAAKLKEFVADISNKKAADIEIISGLRSMHRNAPTANPSYDQIVRTIEDTLYKNGEDNYLSLNDLIKDSYGLGTTIEEKLKALDILTENKMRAKVHFFLPALDKGARYKLNGCSEELPMFVCSECGHLIIGAETDHEGKLIPLDLEIDKRDIFDEEEDFDTDDDSSDNDDKTLASKERLISLGNPASPYQSPLVSIKNSKIVADPQFGSYIYSTGHVCPCCGKDNTKANAKKMEDGENDQSSKDFLKVLNCPPAFIGRVIAPSLLNQMLENDKSRPHNGQQYISFVDSRQGCSRATLTQNVEVEKEWLYSRIFEELSKIDPSRLADYNVELSKAVANLQNNPLDNSNLQLLTYYQGLINLLSTNKSYYSWKEVADLLMKDPDFGLLYDIYDTSKQHMSGVSYINRKLGNGVTDIMWKQRRYVNSIMYHALNKRPRNANAPETLGLFQTYYPKLESITAPTSLSGTFTDTRWRELLKIYLDFDVRNNGSLFLMYEDTQKPDPDLYIDIFDLGRYKYSSEIRRPRNKPTEHSRIYELVKQAYPHVNPQDIIDEMWNSLTVGTNAILVEGKFLKVKKDKDGNVTSQDWQPFKSGGYYLNILDICFKLYNTVYICPETNRPLDVCLQNLTPYRTKNVGYRNVMGPFQWSAIPYNLHRTYANVENWHSSNRLEIHHLWNNRLYKYYSKPMIFVQKEHTAQLNTEEARNYLIDFKDEHKINILACSTTMEMGVDVGSLELVLMNNVPPQAANYKQRAGRSGRMEQNRSASVALCGQDVHSNSVCKSPLSLINKAISAPYVDFQSLIILQRQINAYVFKSVFNFIDLGANGTTIMDFFTNYMYGSTTGNNNVAYPNKSVIKNAVTSTILNLSNRTPITHSAYNNFLENLDDYYNLGYCPQNPSISDSLDKMYLLSDLIQNKQQIKEYVKAVKIAAEKLHEEYENTVANLADYFNKEATAKGLTVADLNTPLPGSEKFIWQLKNLPNNSNAKNPLYNKYMSGLHFKWTSFLSTSLLDYMATHQFTPNANMPLDIIELIVSKEDKKDKYRKGASQQPSTDLVRALSQFAPGKVVAINNSVYKVGGVDWSKPFDYYTVDNNGYLAVSPTDQGRIVIYPDAFRADYGVTRDTSTDVYSRVSAQFLDMNDAGKSFTPCVDPNYGQNPINFRTSDAWKAQTPYILYYNDGQGDGFAVCAKCGRAVLEKDARKLERRDNSNGTSQWTCVHQPLRRDPENVGKDNLCACSEGDIKHNVIFAGKLQTNFCEMQLLKPTNHIAQEFDVRSIEDMNILTTFAIVLCDAFASDVQRDRSEIDFFISRRGTLCIYDTSKGGAGIANQLKADKIKTLIKTVIFNKMQHVTDPSQILDRNTVRYYKSIDIAGFKEWLEWTKDMVENEIPQMIKNQYPNVVKENRNNLVQAINSDKKSIFFFNDKDDKYNYYDAQVVYDHNGNKIVYNENGWSVMKGYFNINTLDQRDILFHGNLPIIVPAVRDMLLSLDDSRNRLYMCTLRNFNYYPIAIAGGKLYFSDSEKWNGLNHSWGDVLFSIPYDPVANPITKTPLDPRTLCGGTKIVYLDEDIQIDADDILETLINEETNTHGHSMIEQFIKASKGQRIDFTYTDEHLKSHIGILLFLKLIKAIILKIDNPTIGDIHYYGESYSDFGNGSFDPDKESWLSYKNFRFAHQRGAALEKYANESGITIQTTIKARGQLPHWRVLEISNGTSVLKIYPDGGIATGWRTGNLDESVNADTSGIIIKSVEKIKFDIDLK